MFLPRSDKTETREIFHPISRLLTFFWRFSRTPAEGISPGLSQLGKPVRQGSQDGLISVAVLRARRVKVDQQRQGERVDRKMSFPPVDSPYRVIPKMAEDV